MAAVFAVKAGESLGEIPATVKFFNDLDGVGSERAVGFAVTLHIIGLKVIPSMMNDLP